MYAIIATGGKQYKVSEGDVINVELLKADVGSTVIAGDAVKSASVDAEVTATGKGKKINIFTYKAKKNIRKRQGHRQPYTQLKILNIKA